MLSGLSVQEVDLQVKEMKVTLKLTHQPLWRFRCPECDEECPTHDHRQRKWRHLDTCGYVTMLEAGVPRVDCPKLGVRQAHVPWAEPSGWFISLFEAMTISWLKVTTIKAVSEQMKISCDEATGFPLESWERAVKRGLARRESRPIEDLAVDETSFNSA
jgi:transposase